jgi:hypothetical protein
MARESQLASSKSFTDDFQLTGLDLWSVESRYQQFFADTAAEIGAVLVSLVPAFANLNDRRGGDCLEAKRVSETRHPPVQPGAVRTPRNGQGNGDDRGTRPHVAVLMNEATDLNLDVLGCVENSWHGGEWVLPYDGIRRALGALHVIKIKAARSRGPSAGLNRC